MNDALLVGLADHLMPGFGFFGDTDPFALQVDINSLVDGVALYIKAPNPEFLNIGSIEFFGKDGTLYDRAEIIDSVALTSTLGEATPEDVNDRFIKGQMLHSSKEDVPRLKVMFKEALSLSHIVILNRGDGYGRRSRFLIVEVSASQVWTQVFENCSELRKISALKSIGTMAGVDVDLAHERDILPKANLIFNKLQKVFENEDPALAILELCHFLPVYGSSSSMTDFQKLVCAVICLKILGDREYVATKSIKPLKLVFDSTIAIQRVQAETSRVKSLWLGEQVEIVISKHGIHRSRLVERKDDYLEAVKEACSLFEEFGVTLMICYGTLLGAVRDQAFIPHDDDVDLLIYDGSSSRETAMEGKAKIISMLAERGYPAWNASGENFHVSFKGRSLDFFICWTDGEKIELMMEKYKYRAIAHDIIYPPSEVMLYGKSFKAPAKPEAFLEERYGKGWVTPDAFHEWSWKVERFDRSSDEVANAMALRRDTQRKSIGRTCMIAWGQRVGKGKSSPPKNSLPIIAKAIEYGFDSIELDIRISADDVPVLAHDDKLTGPDGSIYVTKSTVEELSRFNLGLWQDEPCFIHKLEYALTKVADKDIMIDPRMRPDQLELVRNVVDAAGFARERLQFCVYDLESAHELIRLFPESVLLWKTGLPFHDVGTVDLDKAVALGMDGVMLIWPLYDQDFSAFTEELRKRNLRVLYYIHGGGYPRRPYPDDPKVSLQNMIDAGVEYVTSTAQDLPLFKQLVGVEGRV